MPDILPESKHKMCLENNSYEHIRQTLAGVFFLRIFDNYAMMIKM
jgi:hypothetical protein